jgi:hypothetical protein
LNDKHRIDWLEMMGNRPEGLFLHSLRAPTGKVGLGLAVTGRPLRKAIDEAAGKNWSKANPGVAK